MFDGLSRSLEKAWDSVRKDGKLTADNIKTPMREIRRALLEADVSTAPAMQDEVSVHCMQCTCHAGGALSCRLGHVQGCPNHAGCFACSSLHPRLLPASAARHSPGSPSAHKVPMCNADRPALQVSLPVALDSMKCRVRCRVLHILNTCQATQ